MVISDENVSDARLSTMRIGRNERPGPRPLGRALPCNCSRARRRPVVNYSQRWGQRQPKPGRRGRRGRRLPPRIDELRSSVEGLRRQADGRDGLLARIRRERSDAGAASDRLALVRDQLTKESIADAALLEPRDSSAQDGDFDGATDGWGRLCS
jgi:hypothetical protein